jgi:hypothetical protein
LATLTKRNRLHNLSQFFAYFSLKFWARNEHYRTAGTACKPAEKTSAAGVQAQAELPVGHRLNIFTLRDGVNHALSVSEVRQVAAL